MVYISPQTKRLCGASAAAFVVMVFLYTVMLGGGGGGSKSSTSSSSSATTGGGIADTNNNNEVCPVMPAVYDIGDKKPIWVAGYPGSGFDLLAPLIAYSTGLTAVDVYRAHTCSVPARPGAAVTGACLSHFPVIAKDAPSSVALTGAFYNPNVMFVIRNPVKAIPSYFTRWWGAQKHVQVRNKKHCAFASDRPTMLETCRSSIITLTNHVLHLLLRRKTHNRKITNSHRRVNGSNGVMIVSIII
jgi:hypothetical protein